MGQNIYQLKVTLSHSQPPIWRCLQVKGDTTLEELHDVLQAAMGWSNSHLHVFRAGRISYGEPDPHFPDDTINERKIRLDKIVTEGDTFIYEYDFGDSWEHEIKVEKILSAESGASYPVCLAGECACPPEDCGGIPGYDYLLEALSDPANPKYTELLEWIDEDFDPEAFDLDAVNAALGSGEIDSILPPPVYSDEQLAQLDSEELLDLMIDDEDRVPRNVIDECACRGDEMVGLLSELLADDDIWSGECELGEWWLLLHAVMILGLIPSERAGLLLIDFMRRMSDAEEDSLQEWLAGYWPALFQNKSETVVSPMRELCQDRSVDWFIRANAIDVVVADTKRNGESALEQAIDWLAGIAAEEREDWELRLSAGYVLLCFPRTRHRALLDDLVSRQPERVVYFSADEVQKAYLEMKDQPEWECFKNPWQFYDPEAIEKRQQRWEEEIIANESGEWEEDDWDFDADVFTPYMREIPKTGRNDPCPCGSGKKYKKCCLQ
ncbi:MAG: DUF1186 domain-containing protein [Gammaproteobacteria bacterium]|nr:DUF1186 domain-containing protein [Gammaproteobacteria bacterium]